MSGPQQDNIVAGGCTDIPKQRVPRAGKIVLWAAGALVGLVMIIAMIAGGGRSHDEQASYDIGREYSGIAQNLLSMGWEGERGACDQALKFADVWGGFTGKFDWDSGVEGCVDGLAS